MALGGRERRSGREVEGGGDPFPIRLDGRGGQEQQLAHDQQDDTGQQAAEALRKGVRRVRREAREHVEEQQPRDSARRGRSVRGGEGDGEADHQHPGDGGDRSHGESGAEGRQRHGHRQHDQHGPSPVAAAARDRGEDAERDRREEGVDGDDRLVQHVEGRVEARGGRDRDPYGLPRGPYATGGGGPLRHGRSFPGASPGPSPPYAHCRPGPGGRHGQQPAPWVRIRGGDGTRSAVRPSRSAEFL